MRFLRFFPWTKHFWRHSVSLVLAIIGGIQILVAWGDGTWSLAKSVLLAGVLAALFVAFYLEISDEIDRQPFLVARPEALSDFNQQWLRTGGHVVIVTRDFSWSMTEQVLHELERKARNKELTLILQSGSPLTTELKALGAEVISSEDLGYTHKLRYSISRYGAADSVVLFHRIVDGKVVFLRRTSEDFPEFWLAQDMVELLRRMRGRANNNGGAAAPSGQTPDMTTPTGADA